MILILVTVCCGFVIMLDKLVAVVRFVMCVGLMLPIFVVFHLYIRFPIVVNTWGMTKVNFTLPRQKA